MLVIPSNVLKLQAQSVSDIIHWAGHKKMAKQDGKV